MAGTRMTTEGCAKPAASARLISARQVPNLVTILRIVLVAPAAWFLWHDQVGYALALIAVAGLSDAVDGELARRFNWRTRFGAIADPAADKLLVVVIFAALAIQGHLPVWLLTVVVARDVVILSGALTYRRLFGHLDIEPMLLSKINTGSQVVLLILLLVARIEVEPLAAICAAIVEPTGFVVVAVFSATSGAQYVIVWSRRAKLAARRKRAIAQARQGPARRGPARRGPADTA